MPDTNNSAFNGHELYRTGKGVIYQGNQQNNFLLEFLDRKAEFRVQDFLHFKKIIDQINVEDLLLGECIPDLQIIHHKHSDHLFVFTLCDLVALKELLAGAKVMLDLNSIICSRLSSCSL